MYSDYNYTSKLNKKYLNNLKINKRTSIAGSMFSKDFIKELKEGLSF